MKTLSLTRLTACILVYCMYLGKNGFVYKMNRTNGFHDVLKHDLRL